jgi:hypothetical protein
LRELGVPVVVIQRFGIVVVVGVVAQEFGRFTQLGLPLVLKPLMT